MSKPNPVVHFEMPTKNNERVAKFYSEVFGWKMVPMGQEMGNYLIAQTTETDENGMVKKAGAINGGFWQSQKAAPPHIVIAVDNLEESMKKVEEEGGKITGGSSGPGKIDQIPGVGRYISFEDTEGNQVGMLEPSPMS